MRLTAVNQQCRHGYLSETFVSQEYTITKTKILLLTFMGGLVDCIYTHIVLIS